MERVYQFTNENVSSYESLYNFSSARVLSVLGSGDQYFSSILYGAKEVELYDINILAWDIFILKNYGIRIFSYDEFYDYFVRKQMNDIRYFKRLLPYLPNATANRLVDLYQKNNALYKILCIERDGIVYENGDTIPYFDREKYYQLQSILSTKELPIFYLTNFLKLPYQVSGKSYDIILTSNIFEWLYGDIESDFVEDYKEKLSKFNYSEIQALYHWGELRREDIIRFENNGFDVQPVARAKNITIPGNDYVVSLRKNRIKKF